MRFESVELVRYGRFTTRQLQFPRKECDFHLVLGRNEAGKSTLRQAFHDLLFGIPMNTPMSFLFPGSELELRAILSAAAGELAFGRRRRRNGGLVDASGEPLAPEALRPWLGDMSEAFYERMFGLDHRRLEQGGRAMLQAGDNVDSILFQAAAGISTLNGVLDALRQEADGLWAPRRSRDREWYVAATRLADAEAALKTATVRPATWREAERECARAQQAFEHAEEGHKRLLAQGRELGRLRRSAPLLAQIRRYESLLAESRAVHGTEPGQRLLAYQSDILALGEMRSRVAGHRSSIADLAARMALLDAQLAEVFRQLGRPLSSQGAESLDALAAQLPSRPLRREIEHLLQEGRELRAHCELSQHAAEERSADVQRLRGEIAALPALSVNRELRLALDAVMAAGDIEGAKQAAQRHLERAQASLERRLGALSQPGIVVPADVDQAIAWLLRMDAWPTAGLVEQAQERHRLRGEMDALSSRIREADLERQAAELALAQFQRSHQAVSRDDVLAARRERDALWHGLETGRVSLASDAGQFGILLQHADNLADLHLQRVGDAARLQALQHEQERCVSVLQGLRTAHAAAVADLASHEAMWSQACEQRGVPALSPAELQGWQDTREAVLTAHEAVAVAAEEAETVERRHTALLGDLLAALAQEGGASASAPTLADARERATVSLQAAERARARRHALAEQLARVEPLLPSLEKERERRLAQYHAWEQRWQHALQRAGLPGSAEATYAEDALLLLGNADELLGQLRECEAERDRMEQELKRYCQAAAGLAASLADTDTEFAAEDTDTHVQRWLGQLEQARAAERDRTETGHRLDELNERLLQEGEGRSREQIEAEVDAVDVSMLASQAQALDAALEAAASDSSRLAVEWQKARTALEAISGDDAAAQAEARRQEALADMAEIGERYVGVYAQYRLLERVAERYRERRQGPLLARAGQLFSDLTLGAHAALMLDPDENQLHARRTDGSLVPLDGLSDGTRDQLYLALRLAALELYLDSAAPLPFVADDLFVNYDDGRAVAGLRELGKVARRTQVIFLTHHAHMVELAREALSGDLHLIELPRSD